MKRTLTIIVTAIIVCILLVSVAGANVANYKPITQLENDLIKKYGMPLSVNEAPEKERLIYFLDGTTDSEVVMKRSVKFYKYENRTKSLEQKYIDGKWLLEYGQSETLTFFYVIRKIDTTESIPVGLQQEIIIVEVKEVKDDKAIQVEDGTTTTTKI